MPRSPNWVPQPEDYLDLEDAVRALLKLRDDDSVDWIGRRAAQRALNKLAALVGEDGEDGEDEEDEDEDG